MKNYKERLEKSEKYWTLPYVTLLLDNILSSILRPRNAAVNPGPE